MDYAYIRSFLLPDDYFIVCDGGIYHIESLGITADEYIGDFDSAAKPVTERTVTVLPCEKDDTDTLAAIKHGLSLGYDRFLLYAAGGGRVEHTFANIQCLLYLKEHGAVGYMMDGAGMTLVLRDEEVSFNANLEGYISVLALSKECKGVTMTGLKYELPNETITNSYPLGISNECIGVKSTVKVTEGDVLVVVNYVSGEED